MRESFGEDHRLVEVWLWLVTSASSSSIGIFRPNMRKLATETYLGGAADALQAVKRIASAHADKLRFDPVSGYVWVVNAAQRQHGNLSTKDNRLKSGELKAEFVDAMKSPFWGEFLTAYARLFEVMLSALGIDPYEALGKPLASPSVALVGEMKALPEPLRESDQALAKDVRIPALPCPALPIPTQPGHAREDSNLTMPRSLLEAEIAESQAKAGAVREWEPERIPLVARSVLRPRELTPEEIAILETPIGGDEAFDLTAPMPELPSMKGRSRQSYVEKARELYGHQPPEVQAKRIAEVEVYQAKVDAKEAEAAAARSPEDAAFEEALATWVDLYSLDERAHKLIKRSVSEIPQGLAAHHEACRQGAATIQSKYARAVGSPLGMPGKVAIMRAVLLLAEDGRVSVPGAVDRLNTMLDWWTATDGNPKRRGDDGKDWFADAIAVFGGKETLQAASGNPRDAGSVLMVNMNAAAAWKHARERKIDASKDPFGGGKETYYGIMDAMKDGTWGAQ
jgi:hypothetical protein